MYLSKEVWNDIEGNLLENSMAPSNFISVMKRPFWNSQSMNGGQYRNVEWISNYFPRSQRRLNIREERGEKSNSVTPTWIWRRQIQFGNQLHSLTCRKSHDIQLRPKEGKSILYDLAWTQSQFKAILHHFVLRKTGIYIYILYIQQYLLRKYCPGGSWNLW